MSMFLNIFFIGLVCLFCFCDCFNFRVHPDVGLNIPQLLTKYNYPVEIHHVKTVDGYTITIFRIPHGRNTTKVHKYPVMLAPGTCGCAENFLVTGRDHALGFFLSDNGFDVWITNARGNRYGRRHDKYNPDNDKEFWNFGFHEVGIHDTPTIIDYILNVSKAEQLFYVGHSRGTTAYFIMAAEKPQYNRKIKLAVMLGPACLFTANKSVITALGKYSFLIEDVLKVINIHTLFPKPINNFLNVIGRILCSEMTFFSDICYIFLYAGQFANKNLIKLMHLQLIFTSSPAGCSTQELFHYFQLIKSGKFQQYDYRKKKNFQMYGTETPPLYNLSNLVAPVSLFVAPSDGLIPIKGVRRLAEILPNVESVYEVPIESFDHVDFIFSGVTTEFVNKPILTLFLKYLNKDFE